LALVKSLSYLTSSKRFTPFHKLTVPLKLFFLQALRNHFHCSEALSCLPNFSSLTTTLLYFHELSLRKTILHWPAPFGKFAQAPRHLTS
jgi:hypothetical protein